MLQPVHGILAWRMTTWDDDTKSPNKAGQAYLRLYNEEWRSTGSLSPGAEDTASLRGFLGDYRIRILRDDHVLADFQTTVKENVEIDCIHELLADKIDCNV